MKLSELVNAGYSDEHDLNCAETILYGSNKVYGLELDKNALRLAAGFGGGMGIEAFCGALTGSIMVIGRLVTRDRAHETPRVKELCSEFLEAYKREMGSLDCAALKERYRTDKLKCRVVIARAAEILESLLEREGITPSPSRPEDL